MSEVEFRALNYVTPLDTDLPSNLPNRTLYNPPHVSDIDPLPIFQIVRDGTHPRRGGYCGKPTCAARRTLWQACAPHRGHCGMPVRCTADIAVCHAADIVACLCAAPTTCGTPVRRTEDIAASLCAPQRTLLCAARRTLWQACAPHRGHCGKPVRRTKIKKHLFPNNSHKLCSPTRPEVRPSHD